MVIRMHTDNYHTSTSHVKKRVKMASNSGDCGEIILDEELEVLPLEGSKSGVWQYFGFFATDGEYSEPDKKKRKNVLCKILGCKKKIKYSENTSNMRFHILHHY